MKSLLARIARAAAFAAIALGVFPAVATAQGWKASEDDSLLLELRSGQFTLGDPLRGYQTPQGVCVDLADAIQALDVPVRLDKKSRRATGWFFSEDRRLVLDRDANTVQAMGETGAIGTNDIYDTPEGWCVNLSALSKWAGVRFRPDVSNLAVVIESERKLPFLEALERKRRAARLQSGLQFGQDQFNLASLPRAQAPYQAWRSPSIDVQIQATWNSGHGLAAGYEALASGEALGLSYGARIAGRDSFRPDALRLKLYRNDPEGTLLGPLGATQLAIGDVETPPGNLAGQSAFGRGAFISNRPLQLPSRFGVTTLRGTLPAGWDAELYRNGILRAYQADRGDGRYEFPEIDLQFGENDFEVVLYGPQGQVRHERYSQNVGIGNLPPGKTWYWAGALEEGKDLVELGDRLQQNKSGWRWGVGVERGLDSKTTSGISYQSQFRTGRRKHFVEGLIRRSVGPMLVELSGAQQLGAGRALRAEAVGCIKGINFAGHMLWVDGEFDSDLVPIEQRREFNLRVSGPLEIGSWRLPVESGVRQSLTRRGLKVTEFLTRSSVHVGRASLTVELLNRGVTGPAVLLANEERGNRLSLIGNTQIGKLRVRGQIAFGLDGTHRGFQRNQVVVDLPATRQGMIRASYDHDNVAGRREYSLGYVQQFRRFALRGEGRLDSRGNIGAGLTLAFSIGPDPVDGGWRLSRERLAETGQASVEVYRDENGDGLRQSDEPAVPGVSVEAGFRSSDSATNEDGRTVIDGLSPYVPVLVSIDGGSLADPLLQPKGRGMVVVPRPGVMAKVSLPLAPTGEIEGVLLGPDGEPRANIGIELVDSSGVVILRGQSDFDGYVFFDSVPYGTYRLRLTEQGAAKLAALRDLGEQLRINRQEPSLRLGPLRAQLRPAPANLATAY